MLMSIDHVARLLKVSWDLVKEIHYNYLSHRRQKVRLSKLRLIGVDEFAIQTAPGAGTVITVRKWLKKQSGAILKFSVLATPFPGEKVSGDGYIIKHFPDYDLFGVIDALGHGRVAHAVTQGCLEIRERHCREDLFELVT